MPEAHHRRVPLLPAALVTALAILVMIPPAADAGRTPAVEAHRGGPNVDGVPRFPENSLPALRYSWQRLRVRSEIDIALTRDRVPILMHDETLDRTTNCRGYVAQRTYAEIRRCRFDVLGAEGQRTRRTRPTVRIPTLRQVLRWARRSGALLNVELKNNPTERFFEPGPAYGRDVAAVFEELRFPTRQYFVSGFFTDNLEAFRSRIPDVRVSLLTLDEFDDAGIDEALRRGYPQVAPGWPITAAYVRRAHRAGLTVDTYTLNRPAQWRAARRIGADALITDDPAAALRVLGRRVPADRGRGGGERRRRDRRGANGLTG